MIQWKSIGRFLAPAALVLVLPGMALAADCVELFGIEHCAIGKARLGTTSSGLEVTDFGAAGMDGVSLRLEGATSWEMGAELKGNAAKDASLVMTAFAGGTPAGQITLQQNGSQLVLSAQSTKITSVGVLEDNGSGTYAAVADNIIWAGRLFLEELEPGDGWDYEGSFGFSTQTGRGIYSISFPTPVVFVLPDGQKIQGHRVELIEKETGSSGSSPSFDGLHLTGTLEALTITSETFRR